MLLGYETLFFLLKSDSPVWKLFCWLLLAIDWYGWLFMLLLVILDYEGNLGSCEVLFILEFWYWGLFKLEFCSWLFVLFRFGDV